MTSICPHIITYYFHLPDIPMITRPRIRPRRTVSYVSVGYSTTSFSLVYTTRCLLHWRSNSRTAATIVASESRFTTATVHRGISHSPWPALTPKPRHAALRSAQRIAAVWVIPWRHRRAPAAPPAVYLATLRRIPTPARRKHDPPRSAPDRF